MWTLIIILAIDGGLFSNNHVAMSTIPGFSSEKTCVDAGKILEKENESTHGGFFTKCIEIK